MRNIYFAILLILAIPSAWSVDICDDQIAQWKMNDNAANTTVVDSSGNGNNGVFTDPGGDPNTDAHTTAGIINTALMFDGTDDYVDAGNIDGIDGASSLTICAWVYINNATARSSVFQKSAVSDNRIIMGLDSTAPSRKVLLYLQNGGGEFARTSDAVWSVGVWAHWVLVFDGAGVANADRMKFYFNGDQKALAISGTIQATLSSSAETAKIGFTGSASSFFDGVIDDVRVFNKALTQTEIDFIYNSGSGTEECTDVVPDQQFPVGIGFGGIQFH